MLVIICGGWCAAAAVGAAPRIEVEPAAWNFGSVTNVAELSHSFTIRNTGDAGLEIRRVISSCEACLQTAMDTTRIAPGRSATLACRLDLRTSSGPVARSVTLESDDPRVPAVTIAVSGVAVPVFRVTPPQLVLDLSQGARTIAAEIVPLVGLRAPLSSVECDNSNLIFQVSTTASDRFVVTVEAAKSHPFGRMPFSAIVRTADPGDPRCWITGAVIHPPDVEVLPGRLRFDPLPDRQSRIIWVRQRNAPAHRLIDVTASAGKFRFEIEPDPAGFHYRIEVTASGLDTLNGGTDVIRLRFQDAQARERVLSVPVSVAVSSTGNPVSAKERPQ